MRRHLGSRPTRGTGRHLQAHHRLAGGRPRGQDRRLGRRGRPGVLEGRQLVEPLLGREGLLPRTLICGVEPPDYTQAEYGLTCLSPHAVFAPRRDRLRPARAASTPRSSARRRRPPGARRRRKRRCASPMEAGGAPPSCASVPRGCVRTRELGKGATSRLISVECAVVRRHGIYLVRDCC